MSEAIPFIKIIVLGDNREEEELVRKLKLSNDRIYRMKLNVDGADVNVIFVFPDPRTRNEQFLELYVSEADIVILCLSRKVLDEIVRGKFVKLWKYFDKHYIILTSKDTDQLMVFEEFLNLGLKKITIKDLSEIKKIDDLGIVIKNIIRESLRDLIKSRKMTVLAGSLKFLDDDILFKEEKGESIKKDLEDIF